MRSLTRALAVVAVLLTLGAAGAGGVSAQGPTFEITPARQACVQPFQVRAAGLGGNQPVEVEITVAGVVTGAVAGTTDSVGQFQSPIPMILLPCADGGEVSATISVGGEPLPLTARFEVAEPVVAPPTPTAPATAGPNDATPRPPEVGTGPGSVTSSAQASALWVLVFIGALATFGIAATWVTRPREFRE